MGAPLLVRPDGDALAIGPWDTLETTRERAQHRALASSRPELLRIDLAVRDWARRDPTVAHRLRRVDNRRMDYMRSLFGAFCPDEDDVEARCMLAFSLWIGDHFHRRRPRPAPPRGRTRDGDEAARGLALGRG